MTEASQLEERVEVDRSSKIRAIEPGDRAALEEILRRAGNFSQEEIDTALELIDEALLTRNRGDYIVYVLEALGAVHGFVCLGPTPLTKGTYDLYWIVVDAAAHRRGYGKSLLKFAEQEVRQRGGRLLLVETSSLEAYRPTRQFYIRSGYEEVARIRDFYNAGDDKIMYAKYV